MKALCFGLILTSMIIGGCTNNSQSGERNYSDTVKGVTDAMNDAARTAIKEEESKRHSAREEAQQPEYYNKLGKELVKEERYEEAMDNFNMSCQQGSSEGCERYAATMQYYKQHAPWIRNKREQAEQQKIQSVLAKNPEDSDALREKAMKLALDRQYGRALKVYNKAVAANPNDSESYLGRGYVYSSNKKYNQAIENYDKAIELNPNSVQAYTNRGVAYAKSGDVRHGIADLQKACNMGDSRACGALSTFVHD